MAKRRTRIRCKIGGLPPEIRSSVENMIMTPQEFRYQDISDFMKESGYDISVSAVYRYAVRLNADLQTAVMNQENMRRITEQMNKYPDMDYVEVLIVITAQKLMDKVMSAEDGEWDAMKIKDAINSILSLTRTKTYKRRTDYAIKSKEEAGIQGALDKMFDVLGRENPELYSQIYEITKQQLTDAADHEREITGGSDDEQQQMVCAPCETSDGTSSAETT